MFPKTIAFTDFSAIELNVKNPVFAQQKNSSNESVFFKELCIQLILILCYYSGKLKRSLSMFPFNIYSLSIGHMSIRKSYRHSIVFTIFHNYYFIFTWLVYPPFTSTCTLTVTASQIVCIMYIRLTIYIAVCNHMLIMRGAVGCTSDS